MDEIIIIVAGDFCPICVYSEIIIRLFQNDLFIANLECPLTFHNNQIQKIGPHLKALPQSVEIMKALGINLVTLANNHILDYDSGGLKETIQVLKDHGIDFIGAGMNLKEARRIYYKEIKGKRIAIINACEREFSIAGEDRPGANPLDLISILKDLRTAKQKANYVILIIHGGLENTHYPSPGSVRLLRFFAEEGATAIIRHHPHWVQGMEIRNGCPIFYSVGNFVVPWADPEKRPEQSEGILAVLHLKDDGTCEPEVVPFIQSKGGRSISLYKGTEKERFMERFQEWSAALADPARLKREWEKEVSMRKAQYLANLVMPNTFSLKVARRLGILHWFKPRKRTRLVIENYIKCEAHREMMIDVLSEGRLGK